MNPIDFDASNRIYGKEQDEYKDLPALKFTVNTGEVITCWKMSFKEKLKVLFTGKVWTGLDMKKTEKALLNLDDSNVSLKEVNKIVKLGYFNYWE